ncbi:thiamine pyrophosphate-dependent enzyme [Paracidobacterium acidisoli]|uniref:2-oxoisovalerate dehydrogenase subunit alpha n=1 Tax=Paracidobacterium acidisoli TaxID=2303751 RepID=A0A372ISL7_9BACT|nr:thiamine pyrophosphate-dependent enzyme [Paracidobacterium acidisoli]MBT9330693.1 hypothetical protein [Paracidobacterium acidisoli]
MSATLREQVTPSSAAPKKSFSLIGDEKLRELYAWMLKCRMLQEHSRPSAKRSARSGHASSIGHEASTVGIAIDLLPDDILAASHGDLIAAMLRGASPGAMLASLRNGSASARNGHASAPEKSKASSNGHAPLPLIPPAPTLEAQLGIATGAAFAAKLKQNGSIAVAFCGNVSAPQPLWQETLHFAAAHRLPLICVVRTAGDADLSRVALDCGLPGIPVDGSDVVAVYRVAYETITRVRQGNGPALIECRSGIGLRHNASTGSGHAASDPIHNMEHYLTGKHLFSERWKQKLVRDFTRELDKAVKKAGGVPQKKK